MTKIYATDRERMDYVQEDRCMLSIVSQAQTTSVSVDQTSSEVHACGLGSSSFTDESRFNLRRSDGRNRVSKKGGML